MGVRRRTVVKEGYSLSVVLLLLPVVLGFLSTLVSGFICLLCFLIGGTAKGDPVDPKIFTIMPRAGLVAVISFLVTFLSLVAFILTHQN